MEADITREQGPMDPATAAYRISRILSQQSDEYPTLGDVLSAHPELAIGGDLYIRQHSSASSLGGRAHRAMTVLRAE